MRLTSRADLQQARRFYARALAQQTTKILVCAGTGCIAGGALGIRDHLVELLTAKGQKVAVTLTEEPHGQEISVKSSGCHGFCEMGPLVRIEPSGYLYIKVKPEDCEEIVEETVINGRHIPRLAYSFNDKIFPKQDEIPFYQQQTRLVLEHCGQIDATSVKEYLGLGGYSAFEKALFDLSPDDIIKELSDSGLRGRGGGGFPAGKKWAEVQRQKAKPKYVVCNGDEGDPGAFMDRSVMEGDPHRMLEGMLISGIACDASEAYIYVRAEYPMAVNRLKLAIEEATERGLLGDNILGSNFSFRIKINRGAGAFVCGEGSALTSSIEGKRGMPRVKPPRTAEKGLFNQPTVLNNVETFANVPEIINKGAKWHRSFGTSNSAGTKAFALTGNIRNTGLIEVPMGSTLRTIIYDIGGGIPDGKDFKAVQIGGPSGGCLTKEHLDLPLDFDSLKKVGAMIGSGGLVVMDSETCMVEVARFFMNFIQNESCGKCVPCREGTKRMLMILERIVTGRGVVRDLDLLLELADTISNTALCGLGKTAPNPVVSTIRHFRSEYEAHIVEKRCPGHVCAKMKRFSIEEDKCKGCSKCAQACPSAAISGKVKEPFFIDLDKCVRCGACINACKFQAIQESW
ncbi:MAG: NADH-quinone oxidoreductase subunit NuoF [Deltaproteobacteria bacterium]|jgi:NADH-quinone oxidoreductase subunit F|nr:NADH-quinone oxidoreductase subunit NuoF [Deltaproteobacteria bacterium]